VWGVVMKRYFFLVTILSLSFSLFCLVPRGMAEGKKVVAILPFTNLMKDVQLDWLCGGVAETLTTKLGNIQSLTLVERMRVEDALKEIALGKTGFIDEKTAVKVGNMIGAKTIVVGAFQKAGDTVRLTARFVDVGTGKISNTAEATDKMKNIFELQDKIAHRIIETLRVEVAPEEQKKMEEKPTNSLVAYEQYSKGIDSLNQGDYNEAKKMLAQAVKEDSNFGLAKKTLEYVEWARPNLHSSLYLRRINKPYNYVFAAMSDALRHTEGTKITKQDISTGTISARQKMSWLTTGLDINIEIKDLGNLSGIRIFTQTKKTIFGIRQQVDYGESKKAIRGIIKEFEKQL